MPDVIAHSTRDRHLPLTAVRHLPVVAAARSAVDAARWGTTARSACALMAAAVQQRITTPEAIRAELVVAVALKHRRLLLRVIDDITGGSEALAELDFVGLCRRAALPVPDRQVRRRDASGRMRYLDAQWSLPGGRRVIVEIDGAVHLRPEVYESDMYRANELGIDGGLVLRFTSAAVRMGDRRVAAQLGHALGVAGPRQAKRAP